MSKKIASNFETTIKELNDILDNIADGEISLDESIKQYAKAAELIQACKLILNEASVKIEEINACFPTVSEEE